jgi:SAM-dependent methyltransferase
VSEFSRWLIQRSGYEQRGFADDYDRFRPAPPPDLLDMLVALAGARPRRVVDIGCGTGLSTRVWGERADHVVGVEANPSMLAAARRLTTAPNVQYVDAYAAVTGLDGASADVVTCSQAFHWMDPHEVLPEAARVLRAGGVFAAYDYEPLPAIHPAVDEAFEDVLRARSEARRRLNLQAGAMRWPKDGHLRRIEESGLFRLTRELTCHARLETDAERVVGLAAALGGPVALFDPLPDVRAALRRLDDVARRVRPTTLFLSYRVRVGLRP